MGNFLRFLSLMSTLISILPLIRPTTSNLVRDKHQAVDSDTLSDSSSINLDSENEDAFEMPKIRTSDIDAVGERSFRSMVGLGLR